MAISSSRIRSRRNPGDDGCRAEVVDLNPSKTLNLDTLAAFAADTYIGWFAVTDKRSGVQTSTTFDIKVSSPTYEDGWCCVTRVNRNGCVWI